MSISEECYNRIGFNIARSFANAMTDNTVPNNKATEKKLKVAIPNIEFRPSEMDAIDEKNWVTVPKKSSANSAEPVKAATDDHNKHQKKVGYVILFYVHAY